MKRAIDDIGSGYSSLAYLKRFSVNTLKIDPSFVRDMVNDPVDAAIVRANIQMALSMNLVTIAEGVETEQQLHFLKEHRSDFAQGYFDARPMTSDDFSAYLKGMRAKAAAACNGRRGSRKLSAGGANSQ